MTLRCVGVDVDLEYIISSNELDNDCMSQNCSSVFTKHKVNVTSTSVVTKIYLLN